MSRRWYTVPTFPQLNDDRQGNMQQNEISFKWGNFITRFIVRKMLNFLFPILFVLQYTLSFIIHFIWTQPFTLNTLFPQIKSKEVLECEVSIFFFIFNTKHHILYIKLNIQLWKHNVSFYIFHIFLLLLLLLPLL